MAVFDERLERIGIQNKGEVHLPCAALVDISGSMSISMNELNEGLKLLVKSIQEDEIASGRVELSIIAFGDRAKEVLPFGPITAVEAPVVTSDGGMTHMHEAVGLALDLIEKRKSEYKAAGTPYYRPWIFMLTDGAPNDDDHGEFERLKRAQQEKKTTFYGIGIGENANKQLLKDLNKDGICFSASATEFRKAFLWLSTSVSMITNSTPDTKVQLENPNNNPAKYDKQIVCEA